MRLATSNELRKAKPKCRKVAREFCATQIAVGAMLAWRRGLEMAPDRHYLGRPVEF